jgi:hypothetical protein
MANDDEIPYNTLLNTTMHGTDPWSPESLLEIKPKATPDSVNNFMDRQAHEMSYDFNDIYNSTPDTEVQVEIRYIYTEILSIVGGDVVKQQLKYNWQGQPNGNATVTFGNQQDATTALNSRIWEENDLEIKSTQLGQKLWPRNDTRSSPVGSFDTAADEQQQSTDPPPTAQLHTQLGMRSKHIHLTTPTILEQTESNTTNTTTANNSTRTPRDPTATPYTPHQAPITKHTPKIVNFTTTPTYTPPQYPRVSNIHRITPHHITQTTSHQHSNAQSYYNKQHWTATKLTNGPTRIPRDPTASIYTQYQDLNPNEHPTNPTPPYTYTQQHPSVHNIHHIPPQQQTSGIYNTQSAQNTGLYTPQAHFTLMISGVF